MIKLIFPLSVPFCFIMWGAVRARVSALIWGPKEDIDFSDDDFDNNDEPLEDRISSYMSQQKELEVTSPTPVAEPVILKAYKRGKITRLSPSDGVIDNKYFFDRRVACDVPLDVGKSVSYCAYRKSDDQEWIVSKVLYVHDDDNWDEDNDSAPLVPEEAAFVPLVPQEEAEVPEDNSNGITTHKRSIIAKVVRREGRYVVVRNFVQLNSGNTQGRDTRFTLDDVNLDFTPMKGDMLKMVCHVETDSEVLDLTGEVIKVISIAPSRARTDDAATVTHWHKKDKMGYINDDIWFDRDVCQRGYIPHKEDLVSVEVIECEKQGKSDRAFKWRAVSVKPVNITQHFDDYVRRSRAPQKFYHQLDPELLKNKGKIFVQEMTDFGRFPSKGKYEMRVSVSNNGETRKEIKYFIETRPSSLSIVSPRHLQSKVIIEPTEIITFSFKFNPLHYGHFSEAFIIEFDKVQIGRLLKWEVFDPDIPEFHLACSVKDEKVYENLRQESILRYMAVHDFRLSLIPGVYPEKTPSFVTVRFKPYPVPEQIMKAMTMGSDGNLMCRQDSNKLLKECYPELAEKLSSSNHQTRFHILLYIAEVDARIDLCRYTKSRVSFVRRGQASEYLALDMPGITEKRPSLIAGDSVIVRNSFGGQDRVPFQGIIHKVVQNEIWLKFNRHFHETYNGEDYDVHFDLSRGIYKKCHTALEFCHKSQSNLWLFPKGVKTKPPQIEFEEPENSGFGDASCELTPVKNSSSVEAFFESYKSSPKSESFLNVQSMNEKELAGRPVHIHSSHQRKLAWINKRLNYRQKEAVRNILRGEARPLPYVIFGPPGTGKTITLVETILQIYSLMNNSRLLIATPSNSSANLLAERLLDSDILQPGDMVRLVAQYLASEGKIPANLIPYCATINISASGQEKREPEVGGIESSGCKIIMARRIAIVTCITAGQLMSLGLPRGHFTHIVIDEAGQASEPEILIPLSFMAHESGQAILAGDPNQLGPVVPSRLAGNLGLSKSLLSRLLPVFPYQRDFEGFPESGGYDPRLVTRLTANYRSLPDILELPSSLFYDSDLDPMISDEDSYEAKLLARVTSSLKLPPSAVVFHGIKGGLYREEDSPSYWNPQEMLKVIEYVGLLLKAEVKCEDIGIITPYQKQASKIRLILNKQGDDVKVGSVEEFQGQERMVIILSTVRTTGADPIITEGRNTAKDLLGFLSNPERLNVAISRARALLIICGDPELLCVDPYWRSVVQYCVDKDSYIGVGIPRRLLPGE